MSSASGPVRGLKVTVRAPRSDGPANGARLVVVHGAMDRSTSFIRLMGRMPDWTIVAYDRRGYAGSSHLGPGRGFDSQVSDLLEVLGGEPAIAFGHSFGGDVVLAAAESHPGLIPAALVWEPPQPWLPWWEAMQVRNRGGRSRATAPAPASDPAEEAEAFMRRMVGDRVWDRLPSSTRAARRAEGITLAADVNSLGDVPVFDAARVSVPVAVGRGGLSGTAQRRATRELAAALPAGELVEIAEAGHGAHLSHPAELARLLNAAARAAYPGLPAPEALGAQ